MELPETPQFAKGKYVEANGINFHYLEMGTGKPLLLLHGGTMSATRNWANHLPFFAQHFRVIAPDSRGHGRTINRTGMLSYQLMAEDMIALIQVLELYHPFLCGFSSGGIIASIIAMRHPDVASALVNCAGYDLFNQANYRVLRETFGGSRDATDLDPQDFEQRYPDWVKRMQEDHDSAQGSGYWRNLLMQAWPMWSKPMEYTFQDFSTISIPTLVLVGDRDLFCSVEEAVTVYRFIRQAELCIVPNLDHNFSPLARDITIDFLTRHSSRTA